MTIRQQPADFFVQERLSEAYRRLVVHQPSTSENHLVLVLSKESLATPEAIRKLARSVEVRAERVSYAGLKDKHAQTVQHVSIEPEPNGRPARLAGAAGDAGDGGGHDGRSGAGSPGARCGGWSVARAGDRFAGPGWEAEVLGYAPRALTAEAIDGNSFELVVRDLSRQASQEMDRRAALLWVDAEASDGRPSIGTHDTPPDAEAERDGEGDALSGGLLVVNYFGAQRFGGARHGQGWIGRALLEGDFESALRLAVATPARKDTGRVRVFSRMASDRWGDWQGLARDLPLCPERRAFEALADSDPARPDFKRAFVSLPYFTQQMAVEAYQSHLWNRAAALVAERVALGEAAVGADTRAGEAHASNDEHDDVKNRAERASSDGERGPPDERVADRPPDRAGALDRASGPGTLLRSPDQFGEMLFPAAACIDDAWRGVNMPVLARKTVLDPRWGWAMESVLRDEGVEQSRLKIPGLNKPFFGEAPRPLFVLASNFRMSGPRRDDVAGGKRVMRRVAFDLPRGAYATVVLRAMGQ